MSRSQAAGQSLSAPRARAIKGLAWTLLPFALMEAALSAAALLGVGGGWLARLEGPVSLALLGCVLFFTASALRGRPVLLFLYLSSLSAWLVLAVVPLTPPPRSPYLIIVEKADRVLRVLENGQEIARYTVGLGGEPREDKTRMGDMRTPEGEFIVCDKGPSRFHKWLGLNYPSLEDAWRGRRAGLITWAEFWYLRVENLNGRIPYQNTALGGAIGIHGGGCDRDWTLGCIALDNADLDVLYELIPVGTPVWVRR